MKMRVITALENWDGQFFGGPDCKRFCKGAVFVAGGISGCPDWQTPFVKHFKDEAVILLNPRRPTFDITDKKASVKQIEWEHRHIELADAISFWFPKESICPITLFELGVAIAGERKKVFVGCHRDYPRIFDVKKQTSLYDNSIEVVSTPKKLAEQVKLWLNVRK